MGLEETGSDVEYRNSVIFNVYSDGSGMTGGPAGIGFVAYVEDELLFKDSRPVASATNHQAELRAAAFALDSIPEGQDVELLSDSEYVVNGYNEYLPRWRERGWPDSGVGSVVNRAHWEQPHRRRQAPPRCPLQVDEGARWHGGQRARPPARQ